MLRATAQENRFYLWEVGGTGIEWKMVSSWSWDITHLNHLLLPECMWNQIPDMRILQVPQRNYVFLLWLGK